MRAAAAGDRDGSDGRWLSALGVCAGEDPGEGPGEVKGETPPPPAGVTAGEMAPGRAPLVRVLANGVVAPGRTLAISA